MDGGGQYLNTIAWNAVLIVVAAQLSSAELIDANLLIKGFSV